MRWVWPTMVWSERWRAPDERVARLDKALRRIGGVVFSGGDYERWDLHVRGGMLGSMRLRVAVEEHGAGRQLVRIRSWPRFSRIGAAVMLAFVGLAVGAALDGVWTAATLISAAAVVILVSMMQDCATAAGVLRLALAEEAEHAPGDPEPLVDEPVARAEPSFATNGFHAATANAGSNGHPVSGNAVALPTRLNMAERGFNATEREE